jgi:diguanylate cyclase (GGDEF)-like protein
MSVPIQKASLSITRQKNRFIAVALLLIAFVGTTVAATPATDDTAQIFARADAIKMMDNAGYVKLLELLEHRESTLSDADKWHLRHLEAWQAAYVGQNDKARPMFETIIDQAPDPDLREQARATLVNILGLGHHYKEAFSVLDQALEALPGITRDSTRIHVLAEASQLLAGAGQYDLAINYADQMISVPAPMGYACLGEAIRLDAEFRRGLHDDALVSQLQPAVDHCITADQILTADTLRANIAAIQIEKGKYGKAIALLQSSYASMLGVQYEWLNAQYNALLAEAYWKQNNIPQAEKFALATVDMGSKGEFIEPLSHAYRLLYQIARDKGNLRDALNYHEKFLSADNTHLDEIHEEALAYQVVKQQMEAKKAELDALSKRNQILRLQQALDRKAVETSRLYILLLLIVLASIAFLLYRMKRSQLRFMHIARYDDLTGAFNRQYFVEQAEQSLRKAAHSVRCASLVLVDLGRLKSINSKYDHRVGDSVLRHVAAACQRHLRAHDLLGRLGGEEFGVLLHDCTAEQAIERADQLYLAIHANRDDGAKDIPISASLGIASTAHHGHDLHRLLVAANEGLSLAKRHSHKRVVINLSDYASSTSSASESKVLCKP